MFSNRGRAYVASRPPGTASYDFHPVNPPTTKQQDRDTSSDGSSQSVQHRVNMRRSPTNIKTNPKYGNKKPSPDSSTGSDGSGNKKRTRPRSLVILGTANRRTNSSHSDLTTKEAPETGKDTSPIHPKPAHEMDPCLILSTPELRKKCAQGLTSPDMSHARRPSKPKNRSSSLDALQRSHECFKLGGKRCCHCTIQIYKTESAADVSKNRKNRTNYDSKNTMQDKKYPEGKNYPYVFIGRDRGDGLVEKIGVAKRDENGISTKPIGKSPNSVGLGKIDLNMTLPYYIANGLPRSRESAPPVTITPVRPRQRGEKVNAPNSVSLPKIIVGDTGSPPLSESQVSSFFKPSPTVWSTPITRGSSDKERRKPFLKDPAPREEKKEERPKYQHRLEDSVQIVAAYQPKLGDLEQTVPTYQRTYEDPGQIVPVYQPRLGDLDETVPKYLPKVEDPMQIVPVYQPRLGDLDQTVPTYQRKYEDPAQIVPAYQPRLGDLEQTLPRYQPKLGDSMRRLPPSKDEKPAARYSGAVIAQVSNEREKGAIDSVVDDTKEKSLIPGADYQNKELEERNNRINLMPLQLNDNQVPDQNLVIKGYTPPEKERPANYPVATTSLPSSATKDTANVTNHRDSPEDDKDALEMKPSYSEDYLNRQKGSAMPVDKYLSLQNETNIPKLVQSETSIDTQHQASTSSFDDTSNSWPRKRPLTPTNKRVSGFQYESEEDKLLVQNLLERYAAHGSLATSGLSRADMTDYLNTMKKQLGVEESDPQTNIDNKDPSCLKDKPICPENETDTREKEKRVLEKEDIDVFSQTTFHVDGEITNSPVVRRRVLVAELGKKKSSSSLLDDDENNNDGSCGPVYSAASDESKTWKGIRSGDVVYSREIPAYDLWTKSGGFREDEDIPEDLLELGITDDQYSSIIPLLNECILCKQLDNTLATWLSGCYFAAIFLLLWVTGFVVCFLGDMAGIAPGLVFVVAILLVLTIAGSFQLTKRLTSSKYQSSLLAVNRELRDQDVMVSVRRSGLLGTGLSVHFVFFDILPCQKILLLSVKDKPAENLLLTQISEKHPSLMDIIARDLKGVSNKPATVGRKIILNDILVYFAPSFLDDFLDKKRLPPGKVYFGGLRGSTLELCEFVRRQDLGQILKGVSNKHTPQTVSQVKQPSSKLAKT